MPRQTGRVTVGRNITLTLTLIRRESVSERPAPGDITGHPVPGAYKYGWGSLESETVKCGPAGLGPENDCAAEGQQQL
jgi:hypothetical protein